jgi:hypothetical protein
MATNPRFFWRQIGKAPDGRDAIGRYSRVCAPVNFDYCGDRLCGASSEPLFYLDVLSLPARLAVQSLPQRSFRFQFLGRMVASSRFRRMSVKTITALAANKLGKFLAKDFRRIFGPAHDDVAERLASLARSTIECLGRSDALYHNFEHTLQVTMVGRDILQGMTLCQRIEPADYDHLIVACLLHDIGYMRGVLSGDTETEFVVDGNGKKITLPRGASDATLAPYHVDRSKLFAFERLGKSPTIDAARIAEAIEMTRFPGQKLGGANESIEPKLVQAADLIGQLGDPMYSQGECALLRI